MCRNVFRSTDRKMDMPTTTNRKISITTRKAIILVSFSSILSSLLLNEAGEFGEDHGLNLAFCQKKNTRRLAELSFVYLHYLVINCVDSYPLIMSIQSVCTVLPALNNTTDLCCSHDKLGLVLCWLLPFFWSLIRPLKITSCRNPHPFH